jgi:hypothetical protein
MGGIRQNPIPAAMIGIGAAWLLIRSRSSDKRDRQSQFGNYSEFAGDREYDSLSDAEGVSDGRMRDPGRRVQSQLQRMARENPLMVGAGALLLGSIVGLAIPETQRENEWLGETRDSMLDKAQELARNTAARAQETAGELVGEAASRIVGGNAE